MTECTCEQLEFHGLGRRAVVARFDGGAISTDGGALLLREVEAKTGLLAAIARANAAEAWLTLPRLANARALRNSAGIVSRPSSTSRTRAA